MLHITEAASGEHSHWVLIGQGMPSTELSSLLASLFELDVATHQAVGVLRPTGDSEVCSSLLIELYNCANQIVWYWC
jgi:hypothetical protein